jgi:hypothetical protein
MIFDKYEWPATQEAFNAAPEGERDGLTLKIMEAILACKAKDRAKFNHIVALLCEHDRTGELTPEDITEEWLAEAIAGQREKIAKDRS